MRIRLLREPGFIYDLNFIFYLKFNTNLYIEKYIPDDDNKEKNIKYINDIITHFGNISDDLYVFYHAIEPDRVFVTTEYFYPYQSKFDDGYDLEFLQNELTDSEKLIRKMIKFYFHELDGLSLNECISSHKKLVSHIKNSNYSSDEKSKLYEFFADPEPYIKTLQYELMSKSVVLTEYYKENSFKIMDAYGNTTVDGLKEQLKDLRDLSFLDGYDQSLFVSFSLLNKWCIFCCYLNEGLLTILSCDYVSAIEFAKELCQEADLYTFGHSLDDESRLNIFRFVHKRGEITCKDLEREFDFSGSTAYHHIAIMTKTGILKTRNEGKTVLYSLNKKYISSIIETLNNYLT